MDEELFAIWRVLEECQETIDALAERLERYEDHNEPFDASE